MRQRALATLNRPDHALMRRFNSWLAPNWVRNWMMAASKFGDGYLMILVSVICLLSGEPDRYRATSAAVLASLVSVLAFRQIKTLVGRKRPCDIAPHCWATLLPPDQFSFPSGHTMTAFAFACALAPFYPGALPILLFFAFNIAASRVILGMHFLSDVVVGAALGALIGRYVGFALV